MTGQGLDPVFRFAIKGIAGGIGLVSESISHRKEKKQAKKNPESLTREESQSPPPDYQFEQPDEEVQWALDDAQEELSKDSAPPKKVKAGVHVKEITAAFIRSHPVPHFEVAPQIALPVILPQRRPKDRTRGFIRAYAPVLEDAGIDQETFFDFLDCFDQSTAAAPLLNAINLASFAGSLLPHGLSMVVSVAVYMSVKVAKEMQSRSRTNTYLDTVNAEFFQPRGLYALVMTWVPESDQGYDEVDVTTTINTFQSRPHSGVSGLKTKFKRAAGETVGDFSFPEAAPLVFPELESLAEQTGEAAESKRKILSRTGKFVNEYYDKRAQARYAGKNPDSLLAQTPKQTFHSRYADPNHPAASGNLVSLITGGKINPAPGSAGFGGPAGLLNLAASVRGGLGRQYGRDPRAYGRYDMDPMAYGRYEMDPMAYGRYGPDAAAYGRSERDPMLYGRYGPDRMAYGRSGMDDMAARRAEALAMRRGMPRGGGPGGYGGYAGLGQGGIGLQAFSPITPIVKKLKSKVLYLMIVNLPTEEQLAAAGAAVNDATC